MTNPSHEKGTTRSNHLGPKAKELVEPAPPSKFDREGAEARIAAQPEKLFNLFAQALFSAPPIDDLSPTSAPVWSVGTGLSQWVVPRLKALLVGFNEAELPFYCSLVSSLNFDTVTMADPNRATALLAAESIGLVIVDWDEAATHAIVLAQVIQKRQIESPLIIGVAAQLSEKLNLSANRNGLDQLFAKPLSYDLLLDYLKQKGLAVNESVRGTNI